MADAEAVTPGSRGDVARGCEGPKACRVWPAEHSEGWSGLQSVWTAVRLQRSVRVHGNTHVPDVTLIPIII